MAFDRENFFKSCGHYGRGSAIADGFEALHAELAELKAACLGLKDRIAGIEGRVCGRPEDTPDAPARETGWAVCLLSPVDVTPTKFFTEDCGFCDKRTLGQTMPAIEVLWFDLEADADVLMNALGAGRSTLLYKDTLEEVPGDA